MARRCLRVQVLLALAVLGCGSGGTSTPPAVDVTGTWSGTLTSDSGPPGYEPVYGDYLATLVLSQSGAGVTGTLQRNGVAAGSVAGGVGGYRVELRMTPTGCTGLLTMVGDVSQADPGRMTLNAQGTVCGSADYEKGTLTKQ